MPVSANEVDLFLTFRPRLAAIAYRMLGSAAEAEDVVQETFLRWQSADRDRIEVPRAWLTKVLTNLCLNQLTSARARRETYVGQWLPEPVLAGDPMLGPADTAEQRDSVSLAVMVMLERLSPTERAVYVLREAFGYPHRDIAAALDISEVNSQQLLSRAKRHVTDRPHRAEADPAAIRRVVDAFLTAAAGGRVDDLVDLLTEDVIVVGDGGGAVTARPVPVVGAGAAAKFLRGLFRPSPAKRAQVGGSPDLYLSWANGEPAVVVAVGERLVGVMVIEVTDTGRVAAVRNLVNPAKLVVAQRHWLAGDRPEPYLTGW